MRHLIILLLFTLTVSSQTNWDNVLPKVPEKEFMFVETHWDYAEVMPGDDTNEDKGIHLAIEFGMRSHIPNLVGVEAKIAYENFPGLYGGFESYGVGFGIFLVSGGDEQFLYYTGFRAAKVYRTNQKENVKSWALNPGFEAKMLYQFNPIYIGFRYTLDKAYDQRIMDWTPSTRWAVNFTLGYNIKGIGTWKNNR